MECGARDYFLCGWSLACRTLGGTLEVTIPMQTRSRRRKDQIARHHPPSSHGYNPSPLIYANSTYLFSRSLTVPIRPFGVQLLSSNHRACNFSPQHHAATMQLSHVISNILLGAVLVQATFDECSDKSGHKRGADWGKECKCSGGDDSKHGGWKRSDETSLGVSPTAEDEVDSEDGWSGDSDKNKCPPVHTCPPCPSSKPADTFSYGAVPLPLPEATHQPSLPPQETTASCTTYTQVAPPHWPTTISTTMDVSPHSQPAHEPPPSHSAHKPSSPYTYVPPAYPTAGVVVPPMLTTARMGTATANVSAPGRPTTTSSPFVVVNGANAPAAGGMVFAAVMAVGAML